jgi:hypothetical protein
LKKILVLLASITAMPAFAAPDTVPLAQLPAGLHRAFVAKLEACGASAQQIGNLTARRIPYASGRPPLFQVETDQTECGPGPNGMATDLEATADAGGRYQIEDTAGTFYLVNADGRWIRVSPGCLSTDSMQAFDWNAAQQREQAVSKCLAGGNALTWAHAHGFR